MSTRAAHADPDRVRRLRERMATVMRAIETVREEVDTWLEVLEGEVPRDLRGSLYRNGPGRMERGGVRYQHPFDGDGMVTRFSFGDGPAGPGGEETARVGYRNRFVRTAEFVAEEAAGRILFRNFGTNIPGGFWRNVLRMRFKNAANTSVVLHGGMLLALWEGGLPHRLDPETLETLGAHDFSGRLRNTARGAFIAPELPFSAHPKRGPDGVLHNFGTLMGARNTLLLYRVGADGAMAEVERVGLDRLSFVHDFVLTPRHRAFYLGPVSFDVPPVLLGLRTPVGALRGKDGGAARILLVPRAGEGGGEARPQSYETRGGFIFHYTGGFEDAAGDVILDGLHSETYPEFDRLSDPEAFVRGSYRPPFLTRFTVTPGKGVRGVERLGECPLELPTIHPARVGRAYRYVYGIGDGPEADLPIFRQIVKVDVERRTTLRRDFGNDLPGEPVFVPRRPGGPGAGGRVAGGRAEDLAEDDGYLLVLVYVEASHRSELHILSAVDLRTLARLRVPHHVPPGFHGTFVPAADPAPAQG